MTKLYQLYSLLLLIGAFTMASGTASAQGSETTGFAPGGKGYKQLNFGFEIGNSMPVYAGMDFGVGEFITIGPRLILNTHGERFTSPVYTANGTKERETSTRSTVAIPSFRADYHFSGHIKGLPPELDLYAGATLGFIISQTSVTTRVDGRLEEEQLDPVRTTVSRLWAQVGGRYFFSDNWGVQLEFTSGLYGRGDGAIGLSYRF